MVKEGSLVRAGNDVRFVITDREALSSVQLGLEVAYALQTLYPGKIDFEASRLLLGNRKVIDALKVGTDPRDLAAMLHAGVASFEARRQPFLLY